MTQHQFMSRQEAAQTLGVTVADVDRFISVGLLDRWRIRGRYVRLRRDQVDELAQLPSQWLQHA